MRNRPVAPHNPANQMLRLASAMLYLISCLPIVRLLSLVGFMCNRSSVLPLQTRVLEERFAPHRIWSFRCELSEYENDYAHRNQQRTPTFGLARMVVDLKARAISHG
jgi:hypothetical protein